MYLLSNLVLIGHSKTSFIKAKHNVGELDQRLTFKNDSLSVTNSMLTK